MTIPLMIVGDNREDFTTYVEADPQPCLTVTPSLARAVAMDRDHDTWLYKDYGANHFQYFTHEMTFTLRALEGVTNRGIMLFWAVSDSIDDAQAWEVAHPEARYAHLHSPNTFAIRDTKLVNLDTHVYGGTMLDTPIYFRVTHLEASPTVLSLRAYSDMARTVLLFTVAITVTAATKYQHVFAVNSHNSGDNPKVTADVEALRLNE